MVRAYSLAVQPWVCTALGRCKVPIVIVSVSVTDAAGCTAGIDAASMRCRQLSEQPAAALTLTLTLTLTLHEERTTSTKRRPGFLKVKSRDFGVNAPSKRNQTRNQPHHRKLHPRHQTAHIGTTPVQTAPRGPRWTLTTAGAKPGAQLGLVRDQRRERGSAGT